jgi:hypothetical protein
MLLMSRRRKLTVGGLGALVIIILISGGVILSRLNQPALGTVTPGSSPAQTGSGFDLTPKRRLGKYASFNYPAGLTVARNSPLVSPVVEQFNFSHQDIETWNLAIAVLNTPGGTLASSNAYQFRKSRPDIYKESHQTINNQSVDIMTDTSTGGFSKVAFLEGNGLSATVSLYGDDPAGVSDLSATFNMVLSSWRWQQ